jgi:hypothetical protein
MILTRRERSTAAPRFRRPAVVEPGFPPPTSDGRATLSAGRAVLQAGRSSSLAPTRPPS